MFRKLFLPSLQNNLHPYFLRLPVFNLVAILILAAEIFLISYLALAFAVPNFSLTAVISDLVGLKTREAVPQVLAEMTNDYRSGRGLEPLAPNAALQAAAQAKAEDMAARGYFSHQGPLGEPVWEWFSRYGYEYRRAGENLAVNLSDTSDVMKSWISSPSHEANLSNKDYREVGIGVARGRYEGHSTTFIVQLFASPAGALVEADPSAISRSGALAFLVASPRTSVTYLIIFSVMLVLILLGVLLVSLFFAHRANDWRKRLWEPFLLYRVQVAAVLIISVIALGLLYYNNYL